MKRRAGILFFLVALVAGAAAGFSQENILRLAVEPSVLELAPGGAAGARLSIANASAYEADDIEASWSGSPLFRLDPAPPILKVLGPFASASRAFVLAATASAPLGQTDGSLDIVYSYCIGDECYQIVESIPVRALVRAEVQTRPASIVGSSEAPTSGTRAIPWLWIAFAAFVLLVAVVLFASRRVRRRVAATALLVAASGAALGLGVSLGQHEQAQAVGAVLCTSCVGIETAQTAAPTLTGSQAAAVDRVATRIELLVFYATWCRSCPYAEALADLVARRNPRIVVRHVDAEEERELAVEYGVTRAGRTVVPAIVRIDTGSVLFGVENLGDRLVDLLEEGT